MDALNFILHDLIFTPQFPLAGVTAYFIFAILKGYLMPTTQVNQIKNFYKLSLQREQAVTDRALAILQALGEDSTPSQAEILRVVEKIVLSSEEKTVPLNEEEKPNKKTKRKGKEDA